MTISAKVIAHSANPEGYEIFTMQCKYPRYIHSQVMTHRAFSRNAQSSRAMPTHRLINEIIADPVFPVKWGANQKGMQAGNDHDEKVITKHTAFPSIKSKEEAWEDALEYAIMTAEAFAEAGYHKEIVNRILEPFMHINVIITATEWENFFTLREHDDAQPEIQALARSIRKAMSESTPKQLEWFQWHYPYYENVESSVAACARVSYNNHDGSQNNHEKDKALYSMLLKSKHMSPFEHQARAFPHIASMDNFFGFQSYRNVMSDR